MVRFVEPPNVLGAVLRANVPVEGLQVIAVTIGTRGQIGGAGRVLVGQPRCGRVAGRAPPTSAFIGCRKTPMSPALGFRPEFRAERRSAHVALAPLTFADDVDVEIASVLHSVGIQRLDLQPIAGSVAGCPEAFRMVDVEDAFIGRYTERSSGIRQPELRRVVKLPVDFANAEEPTR